MRDKLVAYFPRRQAMSEVVFFKAFMLVCGTVAFLATLKFVRSLLVLRHERRVPDGGDGLLHARLGRIELAVESTAIEVERISEANRFMAKLLADRGGAANPAIRPERVITPH